MVTTPRGWRLSSDQTGHWKGAAMPHIPPREYNAGDLGDLIWAYRATPVAVMLVDRHNREVGGFVATKIRLELTRHGDRQMIAVVGYESEEG